MSGSNVTRCERQSDGGVAWSVGERGLKVDYRTVWEFVHAEKLSYKKRR